MFSRRNGFWSHMKMKSPEFSIRFVFCSSLSLHCSIWEQIFRLPKLSRMMVCTVSLLMPNSSAINPCVNSDLVPAFFALSRSFLVFCLRWQTRTWLIVSHFLLFAKAFQPFVNIFSANGFPPVHLHQHFTRLCCSFPEFVADRDVCTLLHCAVTLPLTLTMFNWRQLV